MRIGVGLDVRHLLHQRLIDMRAAGGVEQHDIVAFNARLLHRAAGDLHRRLIGDDRQGVDFDLTTEHGELFLRRRTLHVERGHQRALAMALFQALGDFGGGGGFTISTRNTDPGTILQHPPSQGHFPDDFNPQGAGLL